MAKKTDKIEWIVTMIRNDLEKMIIGGGHPHFTTDTITDYLGWMKKFHKADNTVLDDLIEKMTFVFEDNLGKIDNDEWFAFVKKHYPEYAETHF